MGTPITIFYSYAQSEKDEGLRQQLDDNLKLLVASGRIKGWHRREIRAGQEWAREVKRYLDTAQIILLLISSDFLASCYDEMMQAMARHERREAIVVPILLRPGYYKGAPFDALEVLPENNNGKPAPVTTWSNRDLAFANIVEGLDRIIEKLESVSGSVPAYFSLSSPDAPDPHPERPAHDPEPGSGTQEERPASGQALTCDVLLVTATSVEMKAVREQLQHSPSLHFLGDKTYFDLGSIGGARTFLVQSEMGAGGPSGSLLTVLGGIQALSPSAVIMVGVAFGMNSKKQHLGDILVSRQLLGYELQRVGRDANDQMHVIPRGDRPQASGRLLDRLRTGAIDWQGAPVHFGLMLSGDKLVDNLDFREQLLRMEPEAIGGEMEGVGLYAAAQRNKVDWIVVKAICDWADGKKSRDKDQRQQDAARNAVGFIFHVLQQGGLAVQR